MATLGCSCGKAVASDNRGKGRIRAKVTLALAGKVSVSGSSDIAEKVSKNHGCVISIGGIGQVTPRETVKQNVLQSVTGKAKLDVLLGVNANTKVKTTGLGVIQSEADKFAGDIAEFERFKPVQKLFPISDVNNRLGDSFFIDENLSNSNIYDSIDDGVVTGDYTKPNGSSEVLADHSTYIQPSSLATAGNFRYQCEVSPPLITPSDSYLVLRASAPTQNFQSNASPHYHIHSIKLLDPSGGLITQYKDILVKGDDSFTTYFSSAITNNAANTWNDDFPVLGESSDYVLSLSVDATCGPELPFDAGFESQGYQDDCEQNSYPSFSATPTPSLKIAGIEISNSGSLVGFLSDHYVPFFSEVSPYGDSCTRKIFPYTILDSGHDSTIWPTPTNSVWESSATLNGLVGQNTNASGISVINYLLKNQLGEITLIDPGQIADSGKLNIVFSHTPPESVTKKTSGAFSMSSNFLGFDTAENREVPGDDNWFVVRSVSLKLKAKKAPGSRDYVLDVVGYSDDHILNVTRKVGGFLQNPSGVGTTPANSGFASVDDLALSAETLSDKSEFYNINSFNDGGDHYALVQAPLVNTTNFEEYEIPLQIFEDNIVLGKSIDYSMASYFERLHLDIYPLPSGASISDIRLEVTYSPSNALMLHSIGHTVATLSHGDVALFPVAMKAVDSYLNSNIDDQPLSLISNIPHAYTTDETLKTNYARRWRGANLDVKTGPFDELAFDKSFNNPESLHPFNKFYYDFDDIDGDFAISSDYGDIDLVASGQITGDTFSNRLVKNVGLRFNSSQIYPGTQQRSYRTIDYSAPAHNLEGRITDAYKNAVILGSGATLDYGNSYGDISNGFAAFVRYTPGADVDVSLDTVVILDATNGTTGFKIESFAGFVSATIYDNFGTPILMVDPIAQVNYSFPLSIMLTYNENGNGLVKLYVDNELADSSWNLERDSFSMTVGTADNALSTSDSVIIHEAGLSIPCRVVASNPDATERETTVSHLFDSMRMKFWQNGQDYTDSRDMLHSYVDDSPSGWQIGAFNYCQFDAGFDQYTVRGSDDYLVHQFSTDGSPYSSLTDIDLPTSVVASGLSYHSQIENDMLRFHLDAIPNDDNRDRLWSPLPRVSKTIPRDYKFEDRAFVVESIVEHSSDVDIPWPWDGFIGEQEYGPKIIVSLYSKTKDPTTFEAQNWGLISRKSHYIHPVNDCLIKLSTTFDYDELIDTESEPWAAYDQTRNTTELAHKYFSSDIDEMFVQYDIAYPSGTAFTSTLKLHTVHVGLEQALLEERSENGTLNLHASGEPIAYNNIPLATEGLIAMSGDLNLVASGTPMPVQSGELNLAVSGAVIAGDSLDMYVHTTGILTPSVNITTLGGYDTVWDHVNLSVVGVPHGSGTSSFDMITKGSETWNDLAGQTNLMVRGITFGRTGPFMSDEMNLVIHATGVVTPPSGAINLYINSDQNPVQSEGTVGLYSVTNLYFDSSVEFQQCMDWNGQNQGSYIDFSDEEAGVAFLPLDDEIRGVQTICFGDCDYNGVCEQAEISTHGVTWYEQDCVDGGVIRAFSTYTNPETSGFLTPVPYSGNFYGLRKYTGLVPNAVYNVLVTARTATDDIIQVPRMIEEWEYGVNDQVNYSGVKIDGEYPEDTIDASGRNPEDNYGKAVDIIDDLMFVGSPMYTMPDEDGYPLEEAGTVFVYRRRPEPSGSTWANHKAGWDLEAKLSLPDGHKRDRYTDTVKTFPDTDFTGTQRVWSVNQEGRRLGHSLSAAKSGDRELVAVGGPSAKWTRTFSDLETEEINVALFVVTNEFQPTVKEGDNESGWEEVADNLLDKSTLFTYFSSPSVKFNVKIVIVEPILGLEDSTPDFPSPAPDFIVKRQINRHTEYDYTNPSFLTKNADIVSQLKEIYHEEFPITSGVINSGIPAVFGVYVDDSASLRERAVQPAMSQFIDYWRAFSFASGLQNIDGTPASGYVSYVADTDENWVAQSNAIIDDVLSTGNAVSENYYDLFASGVGPAFYQINVTESNTPPASGGALFIFENFENGWTPIQRIDSPTTLNSVAPDHYAHAVDMSEDGSTLVVGSPYINEAVQVYFRNDDAAEEAYSKIGSWLDKNRTTNAYVATTYYEWLDRVDASGDYAANVYTYNNLNPSGKYQYRTDESINEFNIGFTSKYSDISLDGAWKFLIERFLPTQRLGYSVATNEDGSIIAAGSPTDSMNTQDSIPLYYRPGVTQDPDAWYSNVNAGSVSVWDSRNYYPHTKAIEYGRFGNLHEILNKDSDPVGTYDHMRDIYANIGVEFTRQEFFDTEIPQDAGLMFLITPASGALSDEILDNIEDWLSYGDRHLVVVGNDPLYEDGGVYQESTSIVNDLLRNIGSRMVIQPARNVYEATVSGVQYSINAVPSDVPEKTISLLGTTAELTGSGYGDIRLYDERIDTAWNCSEADYIPEVGLDSGPIRVPQYWELNDKCKPVQKHYGDLRARWQEACLNEVGGIVIFENNLAKSYGTYTPPCGSIDPDAPKLMPQGEPRPVLVAAEYKPERTIVYPSSVEIAYEKVYTGEQVVGQEWTFAGNGTEDADAAFYWTAESGLSTSGTYNQNIGNSASDGLFYNPDLYNGKDGLLQATATTTEKVARFPYVWNQTFAGVVGEPLANGSEVILINNVALENKDAIDGNDGDKNQNFYANLVGKDKNGNSKIAQIGGWTGRANFTDGFHLSAVDQVFRRNGNTVDLNVSMDDLELAGNGYNVAWIANSSGVMSASDIAKMQNWLSQGNKKLIITFGADPAILGAYDRTPSVAIASATTQTCSDLNLSIKPGFLPGFDRYGVYENEYDQSTGIVNVERNAIPLAATEDNPSPDSIQDARLNMLIGDTYVGNGFIGLDTSITAFNLRRPNTFQGTYTDNMIPIHTVEGSVVHGYWNVRVQDVNFVNQDIPMFKTGVDKLTFPAVAGSGYRVFITTASESVYESGTLKWAFANAFGEDNTDELSQPAKPIPAGQPYKVQDIDNATNTYYTVLEEDFYAGVDGTKLRTNPNTDSLNGRTATRVCDIQVPSGVGEITIYLNGNDINRSQPESPLPKTPRLISISGCFVPMQYENVTRPAFELVEVEVVTPERTVVIPATQDAIETLSNKYCPVDDDNTPGPEDGNGYACSGYFYDQAGEVPRIKDGPVVVAQEIYFNRPFDAGLNRSRVTVISDASLVQGGTILNAQSGINPSLMNFLQGLYPDSPQVESPGRAYDQYEKIVSLERTSPQKLFANTGNSGIMMRFEGTGSGLLNSGVALTSFTDTEQTVTNTGKWKYGEVRTYKAPTYLIERDFPLDDLGVELTQEAEIVNFSEAQYEFGGTSKFSGIYDGEFHSDASYKGGMPTIMQSTGHDYLDFKFFPSGYPGDLFGYSISLFGKKLLVGSPFVAWEADEEFTNWEASASGTTHLSGSLSGAVIGHNGGAGAAYLYEINNEGETVTGNASRWGMTRKFRPSGINTGQDLTDSAASQAYKYLGLNNYTDAELAEWSTTSDMFGYDVVMKYDLLAITAPGHDFANTFEETPAAYQRKSFDQSFNIQNVVYTDLGGSGVRDGVGSGTAVLNNGAVFTYQNNITNWGQKEQSWVELQKVIPQGYNARQSGVSENDMFGYSVGLSQGLRSDGSYTMAVGSPYHDYAVSGDAATMSDAGAGYTFDAMLRKQPPAVAKSGSWIDANIYGAKPLSPDASVGIILENGTVPNQRVTVEGAVVTDSKGQMFIEASGQDLSPNGYIEHRPYIEAVQGCIVQGEEIYNMFRLTTLGGGPIASGATNLYVGSTGGTVYNNIGMYAGGILGYGSGNMNLMVYTPSGTLHTSTVNMVASGTGFNTEELFLRVRAKSRRGNQRK